MSLKDRIPHALQNLADRFAAEHESSLQQLAGDAASISKPETIDFGTLDLNKLVPDISLNLSHLRALLSSAFLNIERLDSTRKQVDAACWLISDALKELSDIESIYYAEPETPDPAV